MTRFRKKERSMKPILTAMAQVLAFLKDISVVRRCLGRPLRIGFPPSPFKSHRLSLPHSFWERDATTNSDLPRTWPPLPGPTLRSLELTSIWEKEALGVKRVAIKAIFWPFRAWGHFPFLSHFLGIFVSGLFPILYMATSIARKEPFSEELLGFWGSPWRRQ